MKKSLLRFSLFAVLSAAIAGSPLVALGQTTNKAPAEKKAASQSSDATPSEKSVKPGPFHGKLAVLDKVAKTITVGKRTFQVTSATKIKKAGKPATLEEGVVGDPVSGYVKPSADGKLVATTINFGPKINADSGEHKAVAPEKAKQPN